MRSISYVVVYLTVLCSLLASCEGWMSEAAAKKVPTSFDCKMRSAAYEYGKSLLPRLNEFPELYEALGLNVECGGGHFKEVYNQQQKRKLTTTQPPPDAVYVDPAGSVDGVGYSSDPLVDIQKAVELAIERDSKTVVLRAGTHYLSKPLMLTPKHSGLKIVAFPGEHPIVSGGKKLSVEWKPYDLTNGRNIYVADVSGQVDEVGGLQLDGVRATRARYPNLPGGIEVSPGYGAVIPSKNGIWTPPVFDKFGKVKYYTDRKPEHTKNDTADGWFQNYMIGIGGLCSVYDPPVSYWCSEHPSGGGAFAFRTPSGVAISQEHLPNSPYKNAKDAVIFVWRLARWANWMFEVDSYDASNNNFTFGKGGFQGARGGDKGGDFHIENVFEELDNPGEFYFDSRKGLLYLYHNGTGPPSPDTEVVVPQHMVLVNATGTRWNPVRDLKLEGIQYTAAKHTYLMPHGVPSAGDWALERYGALFIEGTENAVIDKCNFTRLDGHGIMISGYNRNTQVLNSDFSYIGGSGVASWGYTNETSGDGHPAAGVDGTDGNHPLGNVVSGCSMREIGLYEKQNSFYIQAKTALSNITGNVFFNGPRAGINFNDGFGGGDEISHNLVFSTCRESGDHGPVNSWDRQPFLTTVRTGKPSMYMAWRTIHHNFFIDNYSPQENVDNDDGSGYYRTYSNFLVYGAAGLKGDFGSHDNWHFENLYAYVGSAFFITSKSLAGHADRFYSNRVVQKGTGLQPECSGGGKTLSHDNEYFTPNVTLTICKHSLAEWQSLGGEANSTVGKHPSDDTVIQWAKELLAF